MPSAHLSLSLSQHSLTPSVVSDGKDKIGYFRDNDSFEIQTAPRSHRSTSERTEDKRSLFHPTKRLRGGPQLLTLNARSRHHSKDCNGDSCCISLWKKKKQYVYANAPWLALIEDVRDTLRDRTHAHAGTCCRRRRQSAELDDKHFRFKCLHVQKSVTLFLLWRIKSGKWWFDFCVISCMYLFNKTKWIVTQMYSLQVEQELLENSEFLTVA